MVPGVLVMSPALALSPRAGVASGRPALVSASFTSSDSGTPVLPPVESSITIVFLPRSVWSNIRVGPTLPMAAVLKPLSRAIFSMRFLVEVVAVEVVIDFGEHRIVLDERRHGVAGCRHRGVAGVDGVGEGAGVAEIVTGRQRRAIGHREGREQRMRILEVDALVADLGHRGRCLRRHDVAAQAVRNEQDQVAGLGVLRRGGTRRQARSCSRTSSVMARRISFFPLMKPRGSPPHDFV